MHALKGVDSLDTSCRRTIIGLQVRPSRETVACPCPVVAFLLHRSSLGADIDRPPERGAEVELRFRTAAEGGRRTPLTIEPGQYRPHFVVADGEYLGVTAIRGPTEPIAPGVSVIVVVSLPYDVDYDALSEGATFDVMEGNHLVAEGRVLRRF